MAKGGILALIGKAKPGGSEKSGPPMMGEAGGNDEVASALREMFDSLQAGDDSGAALAFKRAYEACMDAENEPDMDMDDEAEDFDMEA